MSEFDTRISQIQTSIDGLTKSIRDVEGAVREASKEFEAMSRDAATINDVAASVGKLERLIGRLDKAEFAVKLKEQIGAINKQIKNLDVDRLNKVTEGIRGQAQATAGLARAQTAINSNFQKMADTVSKVRTTLESLSVSAGAIGTELDGSLQKLNTSVEAMTKNSQSVSSLVTSLNNFDAAKYQQTATALKEIADQVDRIAGKSINLDVSAPRQRTARQSSSGPTARAQEYAAQHGIDLAQFEGKRVTMRDLQNMVPSTVSKPSTEAGGRSMSDLQQQLTEKYEKVRRHAAELDAVLANIEKAKQQAVERALNSRDVPEKFRPQLAQAIIKNDMGTQYSMREDLPKGHVQDVKNYYDKLTSEPNIETPLTRIGTISAGNEQAIKELIRERKKLTEHGNQARALLEQSGQDISDMPSFARILSKRNRLDPSQELSVGGAPVPIFNPKFQAYETQGKGQIGAASIESAAANLEAVTRAVEASKHGIAIVTGAGANALGSSVLGGDQEFADHVLVAYKDLNGELKTMEMNIGKVVTEANKSKIATLGSQNPNARDIGTVARSYDQLRAVPLNYGTEEQAGNFIRQMKDITAPGTTYSFSADKTALADLGQTCASAVATGLRQSGLTTNIQQALNPVSRGGINTVTPHDVLRMVAENNSDFSEGNLNVGQSYSGGMASMLTGISNTFRTLANNFSKTMAQLGATISNVSFGDIFSYIKDIFSGGRSGGAAGGDINVDASAPSFARTTGRGDRGNVENALDYASKNIYRPVSYGLSQGGAILNSVREIMKGVRTGGPQGILDVAGGAIKGAHSFQNLNSYFGLNLLPKSIGESFNQRRSQTLMDIVEAVVGIKTGHGRSPIDKSLNVLTTQETRLDQKVQDQKEVLDSGALPKAQADALAAELEKNKQELKELRQAINAYKRVLAEEAKKPQPTGGQSTGAALDPNKPSFLLAAMDSSIKPYIERTDRVIAKYANQNSGTLNRQAEEALSRFSQSTGLQTGVGGGIRLVPQQDVLGLVKEFYGEKGVKGVDSSDVQGVSIPVYDDQGKRVSSTIVATVEKEVVDGFSAASTIIHEAVHELAENIQRQGIELYKPGARGYNFGDEETERMRKARGNQILNDVSTRRELAVESTKAGNLTSAGMLRSASQANMDDLKYMFDPREMYAHIGQALLTGDNDLKNTLTKLYGKDLFDKVNNDLKANMPEVFGDEALQILRSRFSNFEREVEGIVAGPSFSSSAVTNTTTNLANKAQAIGANPEVQQVLTALKESFTENFGSNLQDIASKIIYLSDEIPKYGADLVKSLAPDSENFARVASQLMDVYVPKDTVGRNLLDATKAQGGEQLIKDGIQAIMNPTKENIDQAMSSLKGIDVGKVIESYSEKIFLGSAAGKGLSAIPGALMRGEVDLPGGLAATYLQNGGDNPLTNTRLIGALTRQFAPEAPNFRDMFNERVRGQTGSNIQLGSFNQQAYFDPNTGMTKFALSAKTATGAMVQLNARLDEFGRKKLEEPEKALTKLGMMAREFMLSIPREIAQNAVYGLVNVFQNMIQQLMSVQDELGEIANMFDVVGEAANRVKADFLFESVNTAIATGQGFDEAVQTNLKNFKILGGVPDDKKRAELANQISTVQLGAQTAFDISLEQSLESIPAILTSIGDSLGDINDPVQKNVESVRQLQEVMDKMVVAQRASGASGEEMITVFSRLASSAKEYGLDTQELIALTATSSVSIGKGSDETSNILRALLEGTYSEEKQSALKSFGITTKVVNEDTGQIQNRDFNDIMEDLVKFTSSPETSDRAPQLYQVFGGPKLAPDIAKVIRGYGSNYERVDETIGQDYTGDNFDKLVTQKSANIKGEINKLNAAATQLFGSLLIGTGIMDKITALISNLSEGAISLTSLIKDNAGSFKNIVDYLLPIIKFFTVAQASKNFNLFGGVAKGIGNLEQQINASIAKISDIGAVGEGAGSRFQKAMRVAAILTRELATVSTDAGATIAQEFNKAAGAVDRLNNSLKPAQTRVAQGLRNQASNLQASAATGDSPSFLNVGADISETERRRRLPVGKRLALVAVSKKEREAVGTEVAAEAGRIKQDWDAGAEKFNQDIDRAKQRSADIAVNAASALEANVRSSEALSERVSRKIVDTSTKTATGIKDAAVVIENIADPGQGRLSKIRESLYKPGQIAGSMIAPIGFDLMTGGFGNDNLINTAGAGIAGAFAGAIAGPQGAIIGYTLGKSFLEYIDLPGLIGTSETEASTFADLIVNKGRTEEQKKPVEQRQEEAKILNEGIKEFRKKVNLDSIMSGAQQQGGITGFAGSYLRSSVSSSEIANYKRLVVDDKGSGIADSVTKLGLQSKSEVGILYRALAENEIALDAYMKSGVSSIEEFSSLLNAAERGEGPLADQVKELGFAQTQAADQTAANGEIEKQRVLLEVANDLIESINGNLTAFNEQAAKMREIPFGLTEYGNFGTKTQAFDDQFAPKIDAIRSGKITGDEAKRIMEQYDQGRASLTNLPSTLQQLMPFAQNLGLNTQGLEQNLYNVGAEGQGQLLQRFSGGIEADQFVQDYESRQRAMQAYEKTDLYKAKDASILKEHEALQKALAADKQRYDINKQYLNLIKSQTDVLLTQTGEIEKQNQVRQLISAGTPATFNPLSIFNTQGSSADQINKAIEQALAKQQELEKLSPGYKKYFAEQQFLMQGKGGFKPVTGIDQGFLQEALSRQQTQLKPPNIEDLSQLSDNELQKTLARARELQGQAVALNPDLASKYEDERLMIFRKNNQLLQETGLSQEYLKLALQENTKSNETLRGHYNVPSSYRTPTVWDYYAEGGKETGDVNFPNQMGQGSMVPLSFAQQLAQEILKGAQGSGEGADLSAITNTTGPGGGPPKFYTGGSPEVWSDPIPPMPLPDSELIKRLPEVREVDELRASKPGMLRDAADARKERYQSLHNYDSLEETRSNRGKSGGNAIFDGVKDAVEKTKNALGITDDQLKNFGKTAVAVTGLMTGISAPAAQLAVNTNAFNTAVAALIGKVAMFDLGNAIKRSNITVQVTIAGQPVPPGAATVTVNSATGGGGATLTGQPKSRTRAQ